MKRFEQRILLSPPHMSGQEMKYIEAAFNDNFITPLGPNVTKFEEQMVSYLGEHNIYAVAMSSGTAAIHIALRLIGVKPGEEIFCSSSTFIASANPIMYEKAVPVFIDSESETWNICPESLLKAIEHKKKKGTVPRVLICADLFGMSANYQKITDICDQHNIIIIEDAAEALGSKYKNRKCGVFGQFGILSFNGNKIITTSGGGMLITHSKTEAEKALFLITQARDKAPYYLHSEVGYNYRMSNICAGIGIGQLNVIDDRVKSRRKNFDLYLSLLKKLPVQFVTDNSDSYSNHWLTTILLHDDARITPSDIIKKLEEHNIEARHIWKPMHTQPIFNKNEFYSVCNNSVSERIFDKGLCLPSGSSLKESEIDSICKVIYSCF